MTGSVLNFGNLDYAYNGLGQRVSQEINSVVTQYLLDVQPGLWKVIAASDDDFDTANRYIHDPVTGHITQHQNDAGDWHYPAGDALGTVRSVYDDTLTPVYTAERSPYGVLINSSGANPTPYEYTGEPMDANGLQYHRARYLDTVLGNFISLDPLETPNRYSYAGGNPISRVDFTGLYDTPLPGDFGGSCQEDDEECQCPDGSSPTNENCHFHYCRGRAAQWAAQASRDNYNSPPLISQVSAGGFNYSGYLTGRPAGGGREQATGSATFVSEALFRGGMPMTISAAEAAEGSLIGTCFSNEPGAAAGAWRRCPSDNSASRNWRGHIQLRDYLSGSGSIIGANTTTINVNGSTDPTRRGVPVGVSELVESVSGLTARAGDYVITNPNDSADIHGFIVVGWGDPIDCDAALGFKGSLQENPGGYKVPYIADYNYGYSEDGGGLDWTQYPGSRPYYCAGFSVSGAPDLGYNQPFAGARTLTFVTIPDNFSIPCNRLYQP